MTTLQEAARKALYALEEATTYTSSPSWSPSMTWDCESAITALRTALAQQELPQKERPDFMAGYDAGMADAKRMAQQGEPVCAGCGIPAGDVHMSTCKSGKWPSRVSNGDTAAPAPVEQRCTYCDGTGDVHSIDGEWRGTCHCAAAPAPQPAQWESLNLAREVLKLNALWNKSTVQAPEISDQLGICRVLAERVNTDD